jgi:hypothetical protein
MFALALATMAAGKSARPRAPAPDPGERINNAYFHGTMVAFAPEAVPGTRQARVGPWLLGMRVGDRKPRDERLNVYLVSPGQQHHWEGAPEFDHNLVINVLPAEGVTREFDVFYAIVLDPHLREDIRDERTLLFAAQERFIPGDLYEVEDAPGAPFLRNLLHVDSLDELKQYRDREGSLPRLVVVPAGFAIRATAQEVP